MVFAFFFDLEGLDKQIFIELVELEA